MKKIIGILFIVFLLGCSHQETIYEYEDWLSLHTSSRVIETPSYKENYYLSEHAFTKAKEQKRLDNIFITNTGKGVVNYTLIHARTGEVFSAHRNKNQIIVDEYVKQGEHYHLIEIESKTVNDGLQIDFNIKDHSWKFPEFTFDKDDNMEKPPHL